MFRGMLKQRGLRVVSTSGCSCKRWRSNVERNALCMLYGMLWKCYGKSEVGTGDRPFLFDLFSLLSGYFCFVGFSLSSLSFFSYKSIRTFSYDLEECLIGFLWGYQETNV